jgi:hypothetical protein
MAPCGDALTSLRIDHGHAADTSRAGIERRVDEASVRIGGAGTFGDLAVLSPVAASTTVTVPASRLATHRASLGLMTSAASSLRPFGTSVAVNPSDYFGGIAS